MVLESDMVKLAWRTERVEILGLIGSWFDELGELDVYVTWFCE